MTLTTPYRRPSHVAPALPGPELRRLAAYLREKGLHPWASEFMWYRRSLGGTWTRFQCAEPRRTHVWFWHREGDPTEELGRMRLVCRAVEEWPLQATPSRV